ncbi:hypothetical protein NHJ13734_009840, partial [Beauveria thailandica]
MKRKQAAGFGDIASDSSIKMAECQEERTKPWKGDIFTFESPTSNQTCDSVTITFPDGDPSKMFRTNISGNTGPCAKPEQVIALPSDISGLMRLDWQCADRLPSPCRIITVKDESRPGLGSNATASFAYFPYHNDPIHGCAIEQSAIEQSAVVRRSSAGSSAASASATTAAPPKSTSNSSAQPEGASPS